jgi:hypothetical protein
LVKLEKGEKEKEEKQQRGEVKTVKRNLMFEKNYLCRKKSKTRCEFTNI